MAWATRSPRAVHGANRNFRRVVAAFQPTHIHAFNPVYVAGLAWALRKCPAPLVYRCGDAPVLHNLFYRMTWRFIVGRTSRFVADSRSSRGSCAAQGSSLARCGSSMDPSATRRPAARRPAGLEPGARSVPHRLCRADPRGERRWRAHRRLARLAFRWPHAHLLIAGRISDWRGDDWARLARRRELRRRVAGTRSFPGFCRECRGAHACEPFACGKPTLSEEPYGLVVVEAKAQRIASVIFGGGGMSKLVERRGRRGLRQPEDAVRALRRLETYLANPNLARRHGAAAKDSLVRLGTADYGRRWLEVYGRLDILSPAAAGARRRSSRSARSSRRSRPSGRTRSWRSPVSSC